MMSLLKRPILILIAVNVLIGFFVFRDYGLAWDEPYFYSYADALGYAYSPANWSRPDFDLNNSYGASGEDHKTRGPAYLLLARNLVYGLRALGPAGDSAAAWHLVNFLFFQLGIYFLYRLSTRWVSPSAALAATLLFSTQPLLWGHAFINPKDPPFLTFFLASVCLGFEMVDAIAIAGNGNTKNRIIKLLIAASALGIATSIRVLGPLAGLLVLVYFLARLKLKKWYYLFGYGVLAILIMFLTWPYLWENPFPNFIGVFGLMSDNPTNLAVLFNGQEYRAGELPLRYLPFMLVTTLTEPMWVLFLVGVIAAYERVFAQYKAHVNHTRGYLATNITHDAKDFVSLTLVLLWFLILLVYVFVRRPAMYDGFRHFLFILPPVFIFIGFAFELPFKVWTFSTKWLYAGLILALILPGIVAIARLHPYEYTYYNSFTGGTDGAFRNYETDYWLTCYKEAVERLNNVTSSPVELYVKREAYVASPYAKPNITVRDLRDAGNEVQSGDYVLVNTRLNDDRTTFRDAIELFQIKRGNATFCILRQIP
jgi:hypothetical protein